MRPLKQVQHLTTYMGFLIKSRKEKQEGKNKSETNERKISVHFFKDLLSNTPFLFLLLFLYVTASMVKRKWNAGILCFLKL